MSTRRLRTFVRCGPVFRFACAGLIAAALIVSGCFAHRPAPIAVIAETEGLANWDSIHLGAESAARHTGDSIYWNAPTREDDVDAQIALVDRVAANRYRALVLAPSQSLALISPVRRVLARGIPTVIIGSPLPLPPSPDLVSIINDDDLGGRMAADHIAALLHGHGSVAVLGINPDIAGVMTRERAFEREFARIAPDAHIVVRRPGAFNYSHELQVAEDTLRSYPHLDAILALTWYTADGALHSLASAGDTYPTRVVTFDCDGVPPFNQWSRLDAVIQQDMRAMGVKAVEAVAIRTRTGSMPPSSMLRPYLITRGNYNSPWVQALFFDDTGMWSWRWKLLQ